MRRLVKRALICAGVLLILTPVEWAQSTQTNSKKTTASKSGKTVLKKTTTSATAKSTSKKSSAKKTSVVRHPTQQQPTSDRYKQIQQALAEKGYFQGTPDGNWGPDSVEALKRFQKDQNLEQDGKINSLSLIALGLGPKRAAANSGPSTSQP